MRDTSEYQINSVRNITFYLININHICLASDARCEYEASLPDAIIRPCEACRKCSTRVFTCRKMFVRYVCLSYINMNNELKEGAVYVNKSSTEKRIHQWDWIASGKVFEKVFPLFLPIPLTRDVLTWFHYAVSPTAIFHSRRAISCVSFILDSREHLVARNWLTADNSHKIIFGVRGVTVAESLKWFAREFIVVAKPNVFLGNFTIA